MSEYVFQTKFYCIFLTDSRWYAVVYFEVRVVNLELGDNVCCNTIQVCQLKCVFKNSDDDSHSICFLSDAVRVDSESVTKVVQV